MLKMDIESNEWSCLDEMIASNSLANVKQLALEIHLNSDKHSPDASKLLKQWQTLLNLERAGFNRWSSKPNDVAAKMNAQNKLVKIYFFEVVYLNSRFLIK